MTQRNEALRLALACLSLSAAVLAALPARAQVPSSRSGNPKAVERAIEDTSASAPPRPRRAADPERKARFERTQRDLAAALKRNDLQAAISVAERQHEEFPDEMKASADLGLLYARQGRTVDAEKLLARAASQASALWKGDAQQTFASVQTELGQISLDGGRPKEAVAAFERAIDLDPVAPRPRFLLAAAYVAIGDADRGARENAVAFELDPTAAVARPVNHLLAARALVRAEKLDEAERALAALTERFPAEPGLRLERARVLRRQGRLASALFELLYERLLERSGSPLAADVRKEIVEVRKAAPESEDDALLAMDEALGELDSDREEEALRPLREVSRLTQGRHVAVEVLLAETFAANGHFAEAERLLNRTLAAKPACLPALTALASIYLDQDRRAAAGELLERGRRVDGSNARLVELLGRLGGE